LRCANYAVENIWVKGSGGLGWPIADGFVFSSEICNARATTDNLRCTPRHTIKIL